MFHLESRIQEWRNTMQAAGVTSPDVLRELEDHLRDDFNRILRSSPAAEGAFAEAVANLGQPGALRREFERAEVVPRSWIKRVLFPMNLRYYALATLVLAPWLIVFGILRLGHFGESVFGPLYFSFMGGQFASSWQWFGGYFALHHFLTLILLPAFGILGIVSAVSYLRQPGFKWGLLLAFFQCLLGWWWVYSLLHQILLAFGVSWVGVRIWGFPHPIFRLPPFGVTTTVLGVVAFCFWRRELLSDAPSPKERPPRAAETV